MAGKRIGDHQVGIYKKPRTTLGQEVAAAKAGVSVRSALNGAEALSSQCKAELAHPRRSVRFRLARRNRANAEDV